ncbi:MAG: hypothetical protein KF767_04155 [Bdellovibrionaceae bacterium]|nr:hypothetical protein [Pseudobdellovibrionaceae bacterium]
MKTVWKDPRVTAHEEAVKLVTDANTLNPLQKADLRVDRGELTQDDIKFGLRLYPKGYSEHVTTRELQRVLERNERAAQGEMLSRLLSSKYDLISRIALLREKRKNAVELTAVVRKASQALAYSAGRDRAELKSYLKNKNDIEKLDIKLADVERDYRNLQAELRELSLGTPEAFNLSDLMDMNDIRGRVTAITANGETLSGQVATLDLAVTRAEIEYEKAKDEKWLEHVEISMKQDKREKVYGLEVAINLPFTQATDLSQVSKLSRELREKAKARDTASEADRLVKNASVELQTLLDLHKTMTESQQRMNPEQMRRASQGIAGQDPMLAVELQKGWFEAREQLLDLEYRIRSLFVVYLHEMSVIAGAPETNHLSKSQRKIL